MTDFHSPWLHKLVRRGLLYEAEVRRFADDGCLGACYSSGDLLAQGICNEINAPRIHSPTRTPREVHWYGITHVGESRRVPAGVPLPPVHCTADCALQAH